MARKKGADLSAQGSWVSKDGSKSRGPAKNPGGAKGKKKGIVAAVDIRPQPLELELEDMSSEEEYSEEDGHGEESEEEEEEEYDEQEESEEDDDGYEEAHARAHEHDDRDERSAHLRSVSIATKTGVTSKKRVGNELGEKIRKAYDLVCVFALITVVQMITEVELVTAEIVNLGFYYEEGASLPSPRVDEQADGTVLLPSYSPSCPKWIGEYHDEEAGVDRGISCGHTRNTDMQKLLKLTLLFTMIGQALAYKRYDEYYYQYQVQRSGQKAMDARKWKRRINLFLDILMGFVHVPFFMDKPFSMSTFRTYGGYDGPWPFDEATTTVELPYHMDMAAMFVVLPYRVLLIPRLVLYHSKIWSQGSALASLAKVEVGVGVAIRSGFARHPWIYLFFIMAFPFVALSFIFSNCERLIDPIYGTHIHAMWASYVSLTTVGYGNDESQTMCGRSASFFLIILGIMGTSMLITQVENNLHMTREQQTVMRMIAERKKSDEVREMSAIAIQTVWRKMKEYGRTGANRDNSKSKSKRPVSRGSHAESKEVLLRMEQLKLMRTSPVDYEQDFSARVESKVWDLNREVEELKGEVQTQHENFRKEVLKEMALIQGRMVTSLLKEVRQASSERQKVQQQDNSGNRSPTAGGKKNGGKKPPKKSAGDSGGAGATGNVFATMAVAKKRAAPVRSRRLSRD